MSAMEQSLRRALEAGDTTDPAFRESIYAASERALERMLAAKGTDADAAHAQRVRLAETINRVEEDYFASSDDPAPADWPEEERAFEEETSADARHDEEAADPQPVDPRPLGRTPDEAERAAPPRPAPAEISRPPTASQGSGLPPPPADDVEENWSPGAASRRASTGEASANRRGRRGPFLFGLAVLALAFIAGLLFLYITVFAPMDGGAATSDAQPEGETVGEVIAAATGEAEWITIFDGTQLEMISTPNGGQISAITGPGDRPAVRIATAGDAGEVDISIGPGVVNGIKGQIVRVEITAGSADGTAREFGVRCLFGGDTVCGRQRFSTVQDSESFVFDMTVPADPPASGTIAIDPSFGAVAKDIDLYSVRLRPAA